MKYFDELKRSMNFLGGKKDTIFTVASAPTSTTFTIDLTGAPSGVGTLDFIKVADSIIDEGGLMLPGDTIHSILWDDTNDKWKFTDDIQIGGNKILASDGTTSMTMIDSSGDVTFNGDITVGGNIIKASDGGSTITLDDSDNVTIAGSLTAGGNVTSYEDANGADVTLAPAEGRSTENGGTALHAAVMNPFPEHQSDIVYTLIMNGADVNAKRDDGRTPFHMVSGITPETVAHLLAAGADIFAKDKDGKIPLDYLCLLYTSPSPRDQRGWGLPGGG